MTIFGIVIYTGNTGENQALAVEGQVTPSSPLYSCQLEWKIATYREEEESRLAELGNIDSRSKTNAKIKIKTTCFEEMLKKMK